MEVARAFGPCDDPQAGRLCHQLRVRSMSLSGISNHEIGVDVVR